MSLNGYNLTSFEKFDEALNIVNSLSSCNISNAMKVLNNNALPSAYSGITNGISDIKDAISRLADGEGPETLIDNYKAGYNGIKSAIIDAYIAEYEFVLENGNITADTNALKELGEDAAKKFKTEFSDILSIMSRKNNNSNALLQYSSLTEFFKEVENALSKYSVSLDDIASAIPNLQPKNNRDIAHRGYTPGGIFDNSAEGFRLAGEKGFWGCETDVRFDANGNLVCSHNAVKKGQNPTTFEEYLDICKEYGMTAIIDLKYEKGPNNADEKLSPSILKVIKEKGMMNSCVLQTNNPTDISYIRENSKDARIWYLTDVISDKNVKLAQENKVECVNTSNTENNAYRIKKLTENGIDVCVWNVQTESKKNSLLNMGAKYVMSDNVLGITPYQAGDQNLNDLRLNLSENIESVLLKTDISEDLNADTASNTTNISNTSNTSNISTSGARLTAPMGHIDGPEAYETWYDLGMNTVVENMEKKYGYTNVKASIRSDGVKVLSGTAPDGTTFKDLVMVAADVRHETANPKGTYERGQFVNTTLGKGIVVDACRLAITKRENNKGNHFDIATAWHTQPYQAQAYSKNNNVQLGESVNSVNDVTSNNNVEAYKLNSSTDTNTSNSNSVSGSTVNTSKTSSSENTPNYTFTTQSNSSSSNSSSNLGSSVSSTPSYSKGSSSTSNKNNSSSSSNIEVNTPSGNLGTTVNNILLNNKFSDALPPITSGNLGSVEIGQNSINYELYNISDYTYSDYVKALIDKGYTMTDYGKFIKDNYEVITTITQDGNMSIKLNKLNIV